MCIPFDGPDIPVVRLIKNDKFSFDMVEWSSGSLTDWMPDSLLKSFRDEWQRYKC